MIDDLADFSRRKESRHAEPRSFLVAVTLSFAVLSAAVAWQNRTESRR